MKHIEIIEYNSWHEFKSSINNDLFSDGIFRRGRYLFRGQRESDWPLTPSFDRIYHYLPHDDRRKVEKQLLIELSHELEGRDYVPLDLSEQQKLAFAQHFGMPTRLLDWTLSPYIAAFFAFVGVLSAEQHTKHVAIWVLDTVSSIWSEEIGVGIMTVPKFGNIRLRNQLGKFTLSKTPFLSLEEYAAHCNSPTPPLKQILVPAVETRAAISDLDMMSINHEYLFAGPEGLIQDIHTRVALEVYLQSILPGS